MQRTVRFLSVLAIVLGHARPLASQSVGGAVVQPDSATPLPQAIVVVSNSRGAVVARVLTDQRGEFKTRLPEPGSYAIAVLRIGYRPTLVPTLTIAEGETIRVRIVANSTIVTLTAVSVRERETCRVDADTGLMVARVWNEARKAMITTQLEIGRAHV